MEYYKHDVFSSGVELHSLDGHESNVFGGTRHDEYDMTRMGKKQELQRNFRFFSIVGFVVILQATWESSLIANSFGLFNGGTAGVIWCTITVWILVMAMIASMSEMASIAPTAGGQYHWVSEFAPLSMQQPLSYLVGWCCCLGWVSAIPACGQMLAGLVQGMVLLRYPNIEITALWQTTLIAILFVLLVFAFNIFAARYLPLAEGIMLIVHVIGFFAFLVIFWTLSEHVSANRVFTEFQDGGDWGSHGLSTLVGIATPLWCFIGPDSGAHMSEELQDASIQLPRAMMWATFFNGIMGIAMLITFCFCISSVDEVLESTTGMAVLEVIYKITHSYAAVCLLGTLLVVLSFFGTVTVVAAASRQCWAFARDRGFPHSDWIMRIKWDIPLNALLVCMVLSVLIACINFGSEVALGAIVSVSNAALIFSYIISVGCLRLKRWRGERLPPRRFDLGRWGGPVNDVTLIFLIISFVFSFFPQAPSVGDPDWATNFNWAFPMFLATCAFAFIYYRCGGRESYIASVRWVKSQ